MTHYQYSMYSILDRLAHSSHLWGQLLNPLATVPLNRFKMEAGGAPTSVKAHNNRTTFMLGTGDAPDMYSTSQRDAFKGLAPEPEDPKLAAPAASKQRESRIVLGNDTFEYISTFKADEKAWGAKEAEEGMIDSLTTAAEESLDNLMS